MVAGKCLGCFTHKTNSTFPGHDDVVDQERELCESDTGNVLSYPEVRE